MGPAPARIHQEMVFELVLPFTHKKPLNLATYAAYAGGMNTQNLIKRKLAQPQSITVIRQILEAYDHLSRSSIAQRVCEQLELFNARGKPQRAGCLKALRELERAGHFLLPTARRCPKRGSPRRLGGPVDAPRDVPARAGEVKELVLTPVETEAQVRIWNEADGVRAPTRCRTVGGRAGALSDRIGARLARGAGIWCLGLAA